MHGSSRTAKRKKHRMPCEIMVGSRWHSGLVLDLSPTGLFVQTSAKTRPGQPIQLVLTLTNREPMQLTVEVVRKKVVPARLLALAQGGVGVRIANAPESYYGFLQELGIAGTTTDATAQTAAAAERYHVRVKQTSGPRSRRVEIEADDADDAAARALGQVGAGWKVLDVEPIAAD
jgi:Tfp pilus assembly protein PilZ